MDTTATIPGNSADSALVPETGAHSNALMTADELEAAIALYASQPETPDQTQADDTKTTQAAEAPGQDEDDQPETDTDDEDDDDSDEETKPSEKRHKQIRFRPKLDEDAKLLAELANAVRGGTSVAEMLEIFAARKNKAKTAPEGAEEPTETPEQTALDTVEGIQDRIKALNADLQKAGEEYEFGEVARINAEIASLTVALVDARLAEKENGTRTQTAHEAAKAEALALYPDANTPGTPLGDALIELVKAAKEDGNPILNNPKWPVIMAARAAAIVGAGKQPGQRQEQAKAPIRPRPVTPGQGAATALPAYSGKPLSEMSYEEIVAAAERLPK